MFYILERPNNLVAGWADTIEEANALRSRLSTLYSAREFKVVDESNYTLETHGNRLVAIIDTKD